MKKFLIKIFYTIFPLWILIVGCVIYISIYVTPRMSGDIGKLACIPFGHEYNQFLQQSELKDTLFTTIKNTDSISSISVDVLTIGDSFSQQGNMGYQNYLSLKGVDVVNCYRNLYSNSIQYAYNLLNNNIIDSTITKVLIVEIVERQFESSIKKFDVNRIELPQQESKKVPNEWSAARARDFILFKTGMNTPIYKVQLQKEYFTSDEPTSLYFYHDDIDKGVSLNKSSEKKAVEVFDILCNKAKEKGIYLLLMIAVDKYDLYQNQIVNNKFPRKTINEDLERIIGDNPQLLLTKRCLLPFIENGEKDVFMFNNTHWSYKASEVVAEDIYNRISIYMPNRRL